MSNPSGTNSFNRFAMEQPYGQVSQADRLKKAYPIPGIPDAAKQAQRRATRSTPAQTGGAPQAPPAPQGNVPPQQFAAMAWQDIAASPGASELVKQIAARANAQR